MLQEKADHICVGQSFSDEQSREDTPSNHGRWRSFLIGTWVYREGSLGECEHLRIPAGVAEAASGWRRTTSPDAYCFSLARRDANQSVGDASIFDFYFARQNAVGWNPKIFHGLANDPLAR